MYHGEANESSEAASEGPGRRPYFTSASNAEAWWRGGRGSSEVHSEEHSGANDAASPHANGDHPEDSASDGLGHGAWLQNGAYVEVKMEEEGLHSSRYQARILELDGDKAFVEFPAFFNDDDEKTMVTEWVNVQQLWPPPPPPPPDFSISLAGRALDFYLEEGWWEVTLQRTRITATGRTSYQVVRSLQDGALDSARPSSPTVDFRPQARRRNGASARVLGGGSAQGADGLGEIQRRTARSRTDQGHG